MANLTGSNFNTLKPGILNVSTTDTPASQGLPIDGSSVFIEDGLGVKSGLKIGAELVECIEPTTRNGVVNVAFAERTYANIEDLKLAITAIELYRENTLRDFNESVEPLVDRITQLETDRNETLARIRVAQDSIDSILNSNLLSRVADVESKYLSKLGGQIEGFVSLTPSASLSMGGNTLNDLAQATVSTQAVTLGQMQTYVQEQIDAHIAALH